MSAAASVSARPDPVSSPVRVPGRPSVRRHSAIAPSPRAQIAAPAPQNHRAPVALKVTNSLEGDRPYHLKPHATVTRRRPARHATEPQKPRRAWVCAVGSLGKILYFGNVRRGRPDGIVEAKNMGRICAPGPARRKEGR